jgi:hypothetical protein
MMIETPSTAAGPGASRGRVYGAADHPKLVTRRRSKRALKMTAKMPGSEDARICCLLALDATLGSSGRAKLCSGQACRLAA